MHCSNCDQFNTETTIRSPTQLARVAEAVRAGITSGALRYNSVESDRELIGQPSFSAWTFTGHCRTCCDITLTVQLAACATACL